MKIMNLSKIAVGAFLCALLSIAFIFVPPAEAKSIPAVSWRNLSDTDITPTGKAALSLYERDWKHAETKHFVYHFLGEKEAEIVYLKSEHYYDWIKNFFGVTKDDWKKKSHIFIFSEAEQWEAFKKRLDYTSKATAFTNGWELYIHPSPYWLAPMKTIAHEVTHIVVFRFLEGPIPLFLNEGLAEYASTRALAVRFGGNEYSVRRIRRIPKDEFIDLDELIAMDRVPAAVSVFYNESELFVRHLVLTYGREKFYKLALEVSKGKDFKDACEKVYKVDFKVIKKGFEDSAILTE